eukprot:gnl/Chilomastix_cuspidata/609.p1 GENE.gnl/Chilomastix_cuspidata/609~~gnl/Chilomastix_cuspidata/609.p1  ORF type:complete len:252 (+),score=64.03 gnl/Chilomastix_cuspidata/609:36-758(+)
MPPRGRMIARRVARRRTRRLVGTAVAVGATAAVVSSSSGKKHEPSSSAPKKEKKKKSKVTEPVKPAAYQVDIKSKPVPLDGKGKPIFHNFFLINDMMVGGWRLSEGAMDPKPCTMFGQMHTFVELPHYILFRFFDVSGRAHIAYSHTKCSKCHGMVLHRARRVPVDAIMRHGHPQVVPEAIPRPMAQPVQVPPMGGAAPAYPPGAYPGAPGQYQYAPVGYPPTADMTSPSAPPDLSTGQK